MAKIVPFAGRALARRDLPNFRKSLAAHSRALAAPMHAIPFVGEPMGLPVDLGGMGAPGRYLGRRAALWALWQARKAYGLPDDLSAWTISVEHSHGDGGCLLHRVTIAPPDNDGGWSPVVIFIPAWALADDPAIIEHDLESVPETCAGTVPLRLPAPRPALPGPVALPAADPPAHGGKLPGKAPRAGRTPFKRITFLTRRGAHDVRVRI